jgi:hypothetical protein
VSGLHQNWLRKMAKNKKKNKNKKQKKTHSDLFVDNTSKVRIDDPNGSAIGIYICCREALWGIVEQIKIEASKSCCEDEEDHSDVVLSESDQIDGGFSKHLFPHQNKINNN